MPVLEVVQLVVTADVPAPPTAPTIETAMPDGPTWTQKGDHFAPEVRRPHLPQTQRRLSL